MYSVVEKYGSIYFVRKESGDILLEFTKPSVLFMCDDIAGKGQIMIIMIGNKDDVEKEYDRRSSKVASLGISDLMEEYYLSDLPLDLDILSEIVNNPNNIRKYLLSS